MTYYVNRDGVTPDEPSPGWYYSRENEDGETTIIGPFASRSEALDDESDGAHSEWQRERHEEDTYRNQMIAAGAATF